MSQTATPVDMRTMLADMVTNAASTFVADLKHIPEDKLTVSPGGVARPPLTFTAECIGFNNMIADFLSGGQPTMPEPEKIEKFYASIDTYDKGAAGITASAAKIKAALEAMEPSKLDEIVTAPWGAPMPLGVLTRIAATHMIYHDGQLNYIQSLYGDGAMHWAE
jgi:hypothetical protein